MRCFKCASWSEALVQVEQDEESYTLSSYCFSLGRWTDYMYICPLYRGSHDKVAPILGAPTPTRQIVDSNNPFLVNIVQKLGGK